MQIRLLRVLQERAVEPLGSIKPAPVDVRVIAASNRDLAKMVLSTGKFREDLYYRVRVVHLKLPELRQRREDIPLLVDHLVAKFNHLQGKDIAGVSDQVMARLMEHDYPGNVRELKNIIEQAFVLCRGGMIELSHLPPELRPERTIGTEEARPMSLEAMERFLITETLRRCGGNKIRFPIVRFFHNQIPGRSFQNPARHVHTARVPLNLPNRSFHQSGRLPAFSFKRLRLCRGEEEGCADA
jgi:transcriptional regulator with PAS, ATPase and Fis domain